MVNIKDFPSTTTQGTEISVDPGKDGGRRVRGGRVGGGARGLTLLLAATTASFQLLEDRRTVNREPLDRDCNRLE